MRFSVGRVASWVVVATVGSLSLCTVLGDRSRGLVTVLPRPVLRAKPAVVPAEPGAPPAAEQVGKGSHNGVVARLVDQLASARVDVPRMSDRFVRSLLAQYWRRQQAPFAGPQGELGRLVQEVGLVRAMAADPVTVRHPGSREFEERQTFGLDEGSIEQREAILAPAPATLGFPLSVTDGSEFAFAPAVLGDGEVEFEVRWVSSLGRRVLWSKKVRGPSRRWEDVRVSLPAGAEAVGALELVTRREQDTPRLAFWGTPWILSPRASRLPYNVLFVVVDAMRPDAIAAFHDSAVDTAMQGAPIPPLDAWMPRMPEVAPTLDRLSQSGFVFARAWSTAMWTRPATISFLTGQRPARLGLPLADFEVSQAAEQRFYAQKPPLLALSFRQAGAATAAIVDNMYLCGYYGVGVDTGFERLTDHRYQVRDSEYIVADAKQFLRENRDGRFALFLNFTAPHAPYLPPSADLSVVEKAPVRPNNRMVRRYLGEIHRDDRSIAEVIRTLSELGLLEETIVVITADHGETMSEAHDVVAVDVAKGVHSGRYTHLSTMWEEAARVPLLFVLPKGIAPPGRSHRWVQTTDIFPTLLELSGLPIPDGLDGRSLVGEFKGQVSPNRPVVVEGRAARSLMEGSYRLIARDPEARRLRDASGLYEKEVELYNLEQDPGERRDVAKGDPDRVERMRKRLEELRGGTESAGAAPAVGTVVHLRFATAGRVRQLEGFMEVTGTSEELHVIPVGFYDPVLAGTATRPTISCQTSARRVVGFDLRVPEGASIRWSFLLDGQPWPDERVFVGSVGAVWPALGRGISADPAVGPLLSSGMAHIVPEEELGLFVSEDAGGRAVVDVSRSDQAQAEARRAMQAWGYARKSDTQAAP